LLFRFAIRDLRFAEKKLQMANGDSRIVPRRESARQGTLLFLFAIRDLRFA
jgi:hypothetical protein